MRATTRASVPAAGGRAPAARLEPDGERRGAGPARLDAHAQRPRRERVGLGHAGPPGERHDAEHRLVARPPHQPCAAEGVAGRGQRAHLDGVDVGDGERVGPALYAQARRDGGERHRDRLHVERGAYRVRRDGQRRPPGPDADDAHAREVRRRGAVGAGQPRGRQRLDAQHRRVARRPAQPRRGQRAEPVARQAYREHGVLLNREGVGPARRRRERRARGGVGGELARASDAERGRGRGRAARHAAGRSASVGARGHDVSDGHGCASGSSTRRTPARNVSLFSLVLRLPRPSWPK
jgi:pyruvate/2-oxoglutarate dehydrogenase complex dihydrolipoamide acyltransferase (E2) component